MRINGRLYFDHQATTPLDTGVFAEMAPYFGESFGNAHAADNSFGWNAAAAVAAAARQVANMVGADEDEVIFTSGATEANNLSLIGLSSRNTHTRKKRILVSSIEHKSVLACIRHIQDRYGYKIENIPVDECGLVDIDELERKLDETVLAVSVMAVNNEIGTVQPYERIGALVARVGAHFHCDAAQGASALDLSNLAQHADLISLSAHKMYGPQGIGALVVRRELQSEIEPITHGGGQQNGLRSGTLPLPLCVGMGAAARLCTGEDAARYHDRMRTLRDQLVDGLRGCWKRIEVNGPHGHARHPGNANIRFTGFAAQDILSVLQPRLAASTGSACTSGFPEPSHVLRAIGLSGEEAESSVRFSIGRNTTAEDINEAVALIVAALNDLNESGAAGAA